MSDHTVMTVFCPRCGQPVPMAVYVATAQATGSVLSVTFHGGHQEHKCPDPTADQLGGRR